MINLFHTNPNYVDKGFSAPGVDKWRKLYRMVGSVDFCDRTGSLTFPFRTQLYDQCKLPELQVQNYTYKECCDRRAKEIWQASADLNKPIGLMWSGGIDSTRVLVSFLENFPLAEVVDRIKIITNETSAIENPNFYQKYVLPNFELICSDYSPWLFDGKLLLVTGELNDQLFGSELLRNYILNNGSDAHKAKVDSNVLIEYFNRSIDDRAVSELMVNAVSNSANRYGVQLDTIGDWYWWFNFAFKWQNVHMRALVLPSPSQAENITTEFVRTHVHHFFNTSEFQLWSINSPQHRVFDKWINYKLEAKKDIFQFDKDREYFETKTKRGSLYTVWTQRKVYAAIDSEFVLHSKFNPSFWYDPQNDFAKIE